ncbi:MAG: polyribonucleotide nucleotidyltransferase [Gammaproteobacteria bacterium]|jgi:polyribonucleotide nucleotidyltransferase|nr:polyribonucleotide nucleotidyltransferase [Gammaproteobacteria bacterium]MBT3858260.1 polyribonucleotide nucleotidyltransferase [Gammaproteobacteria bacterium]MBT3988617.1 polyribonucleotide nucleotidyltransferase [Gammaproteobacteria bacterium]MBT4257464.1 polyribonucleotide nucleotidyltransferase [Gammaproteobacteria bacterium]MBT4580445.1 polyribonucleotide nucleotidyltransferase [Gammaproteobacteria bacterium]
MFNPVVKTFQFGGQTVTLETGKVARQATGSVMVTMGNSQVLATVVGRKKANPDAAFFPLTVNYQEKTYAVGKIPGGFFKREGRPTEKETLTSRLIDRPIRPLFPKGFMNEVQVICTVVSADKNEDPDIAGLLGASAALSISGIPFAEPIGAARVGYDAEQGYVLNPSKSDLETSLLDMVVAGTESAVLMVESEAKQLSEDQMLGGVLFAQQEMQVAITAIKELAAEAGKPTWDWEPEAENTELNNAVAEKFTAGVTEAYQISDKMKRYEAIGVLQQQAVEELVNEEAGVDKGDVKGVFAKLEKSTVRNRILDGNPRIDGRDTTTVRAIEVETGVLPKAHGSALFTRGETQALVVTTLGALRDSQIIEDLGGSRKDPFMLHYNFPPYSVGEAGFMGGPKRREIGHGKLARRGVTAVMPAEEEFPYAIRVVSEITESNGSSSMASVCGSSLAMMDAGVPLAAPVAGIAMGLIKEGDRFAVLTDILGDEDHLGDMDFKVAGTAAGVTALQMDIKIQGITEEIMELALEQANTARNHILVEMNKVISESRESVSENAPAMAMIKIDSDKIRDVIGKGGATIRGITEQTGASVDIDDDGNVRIYGEDAESRDAALDMVKEITAEAEVGRIYQGKVARIVDFGAFVTILPGKDGLVHISQISQERVENVNEHLEEGQDILVKCLDLDARGRIKLSIKEITDEEREGFTAE